VIRVLVVDDERQIRRALLLNLRARGYEIVEAATGEAAIRLAASEHPDLVLLDLGLPGMTGLDVAGVITLRFLPLIGERLSGGDDKQQERRSAEQWPPEFP